MKLKTCQQNKVRYNFSVVMAHTSLRQKSECDCFYSTECISPDDNKKCVQVSDPIIMLFNQERLSRLGADGVEAWLKSMEEASNSNLAKLRSQCSDDDLAHMVKSRHLQQPSELEAWIDYMSSHMDKFKELYAAERADEAAKKSATLETSKTE